MTEDKYISALESVLFFWSDPLTLEELANILEIDKTSVKKYLSALEERYEDEKSGIRLKVIKNTYQLVSKKCNSSYVKKLVFVEDEKKLSKSLMETLSVIAYRQPVTRVEIDNVRGVNSSGSIQSLEARGLIKEEGRLDAIGRPKLYGTTEEFLRVFDLKSLDDLPRSDNNDEELSF